MASAKLISDNGFPICPTILLSLDKTNNVGGHFSLILSQDTSAILLEFYSFESCKLESFGALFAGRQIAVANFAIFVANSKYHLLKECLFLTLSNKNPS